MSILTGELDIWFTREISRLLRVAPNTVSLDARFRELGLTSLHITELLSLLSSEIGRKVQPTVAWQHPTPRALGQYIVTLLAPPRAPDADETPVHRAHDRTSEPIAIVGMGCRFPGDVNSPEDFWKMLREGRDGIVATPSDRWDINAYFDEDITRPGKMTTRRGGFLKQVDAFDAPFFGISPREAQQMDPQQRLTLEVVWEALEDAGVDSARLRETPTCVFIGSMGSDYARLFANDTDSIDAHSATGQDTSIISARVSYFLDLRGASVTVNTACSSSGVAIHLACENLRSGQSSMALAGGVHLMTSPQSTVAMTKFGAMSPTGQCRAFDADANGYVRGEGVGIAVLKPLSRALAEGDRIYCVIRGSALNNDGYSNGLTAPNPKAQEDVLISACAAAGVEPESIDYIETHGPGTILGDPLEAEAIGAVFGPSRSNMQPLRIGSIKTNIGHAEAAAGIAGLMKTAMCLYHRALVPNLHYEKPNPYIDFERYRLQVQTAFEAWPQRGEFARAGVSSFGFGGTNCHIVLEAMPGNAAILPVSAATPRGVRDKLVSAMDLFSQTIESSDAAALAREFAKRDCNESYRAAVIVEDTANLFEALSARLRASGVVKRREIRPRLIFVCPGQGTQWPGMARLLLSCEPVFRRSLLATDRLIRQRCGWSLIDELMADVSRSRLHQQDVAQLAVFGMTIALGKLWQAWGIRPDAYVGHSVGEVAACVLGGILSLEDGVRTVAARSRLMLESAGRGGVLLVSPSDGNVDQAVAISGGLEIAGYNSPTSILLSGDIDIVEQAESRLREHRIKAHRVKMDVASHSSAMDPVLEPLREELYGLAPMTAQTPVRSTVTNTWLDGRECGPDHWVENLRRPVQFYQAVEAIALEGPAAFVELSPQPILLDSIKQTLTRSDCEFWALPSCWRNEGEKFSLLQTLSALNELGFDVNWGSVNGDAIVHPLLNVDFLDNIDTALSSHELTISESAAFLPFLLSAKTELALKAQADRLLRYVRSHPDLSLVDVASSLSTTRTIFEYRAGVIVDSREALIDALEGLASGAPKPDTVLGRAGSNSKTAFLFTGQGSQRSQMGLELYEDFPTFREALDAACGFFDEALERPLRTVMFAIKGSPDALLLDQTSYTQPALFALEVALFRLFESWGIEPDLLLGHSIGELAAAHVAGILSLRDACALVASRGLLMQETRHDGAMVSVEATEQEAQSVITSQRFAVDLAGLNGPMSVVLSGDAEAIATITAHFAKIGRKVTKLNVSRAFHSHHMDGMTSAFRRVARTLAFNAPQTLVVSNLTGAAATDAQLCDPDYWVRHVRETVRFADGVRTLRDDGVRTFLELGPQGVLTSLAQGVLEQEDDANLSFLSTLRVGRREPEAVLVALVGLYTRGVVVNWPAFFAAKAPRRAVLPTYAFQRERYWMEPSAGRIASQAPRRDDGFWTAVEAEDLDALGEVLQLDANDEGRQAIAALLPTLSGWRRRQDIRAAIDGWRYRVKWRTVAETQPRCDWTGSWLIIAPGAVDAGLVSRLARKLSEQGATVATVDLGRIEADPAGMINRLRPFVHDDLPIRGILSLIPLNEASPSEATPAPAGLAQALSLFQGLEAMDVRAPVWTVSRGAVSISEADRLESPPQALHWGFCRAVGLERPTQWGGIVDLPAELDDRTLALLMAAIGNAEGEDQLAVRGRAIYARRLVHAPMDPIAALDKYIARGTILITGGTGAIGGHIARWLAGRGAEHIVLVGRQGAAAPGVDALRVELTSLGVRVTIAACDIANRRALADLIEGIDAEGPRLRSVFHAAGVGQHLDLGAMTPADLEYVLSAKVAGAQNVHELLHDRPLDAFVMFSSGAGIWGGAMQAAYASANAFLDALAEQRRAEGRAATAVAWGVWADGGIGDTADMAAYFRQRGIVPMDASDAIAALEWSLDHGESGVVVANIDWSRFAPAYAGARARPLLNELPEARDALDNVGFRVDPGLGGKKLQDLKRLATDAEKDRFLLDLVRYEAASVLGLTSPDQLDADRPLKEAGLDSLMAVEIRNRLSTAIGLKLPAAVTFDYPTPGKLSQYLFTLLSDGAAASERTAPLAAAADDEPIAIVAMSCRFPGDVWTPEELWELLRDGRDVISGFPEDRGWDPSRIAKETARSGGFVEDMDRFDAAFFGISPREALTIDPQQRLLLELSWEALERAGLDPTTLYGSSSGVFVGISSSDYLADRSPGSLDHIKTHLLTGTAASVASGRLAYYLDLHGPAISLDTACSSSLVAVHMAAQALRRGECSLALAGGVTVMTTPTTFELIGTNSAGSPDGRCKSFAAEADGAGWSEGAGMLVLERLSEARRHGHPVLALLRGSAINQDGRSQGLSAPNGPAQESVIRQALASARLQPADVAAVEAHGTGTPLGDPIEAQALFATYGAAHTPERPLWLGSLKSNLGHAQAAAGVGGVIKMVLALQNGMLPRTLHVENPSAHIDWSPGTVRLLADAVPWPAGDDGPRRAAVSAFGISGTNAHVILEEAPTAEPATADVPTTAMASSAAWPILLSAKSPAALKGQAEQLRGHLSVRPDRALGDLAYSLATTRTRFEHRAAIVASDHAGLLDALEAIGQDHAAAGTILGRARSNPGKLAFVFPGQGSQWQGMARSLLETSPVFRSRIEACETALSAHVDWSLSAMLHDVDDTLLDRVDIVQPALFAVMVSLAAVWRDMGIVPDAVIGHSQGEVAAAVVAGAISLADGARIVTHRSLALSRLAGKGGMASVELGVEALGKHLARWAGQIEIAAVNSSCSTLVSGNADALDALVADLTAAEIFARRIRVDYASHGTQVEAVRDDLLAGLEGLSPVAAELPLYSTVTAQIVNGCELDAGYWYRNLREPVRFGEATERLVADGFRFFVEISPHPVLTPALQESVAQAGGVVTGSLRRGEGSLCRLLLALAELHVNGLACNWQAFFEPYKPSHVPLPTYAFQRERFWIDGRSVRHDHNGAVDDRPSLAGSRTALPDGSFLHVVDIGPGVQSYLAHHVVYGRIVVPGAFHIGVLLAIAEEHWPERAIELRDVHFLQALSFGEASERTKLHIQLTPSSESSRGFAATLSTFDGEGWTRHATAWLGPALSASLPPRLSSPTSSEGAMSRAELVTLLQDLQIDWHEQWQWFRFAVPMGDKRWFARMDVPQDASLSEAPLPPVLIDNTFGLSLISVNREQLSQGGVPALPFSVERVTWYRGDITASMWADCAEASDARHGTDITLRDMDGVAIAHIEGFVTRVAPADKFLKDLKPDRFYGVEWNEQDNATILSPSFVVLGSGGLPSVSSIQHADFTALQASLNKGATTPEAVVMPLATTTTIDLAALHDITAAILALLQAWLGDTRLAETPLVILTQDAVAATSKEAGINLVHAAVSGLIRTVQNENPEWPIFLIDTDGTDASLKALAASIDSDERQAALRNGNCLVPRLVQVPPYTDSSMRAFDPSGTVLITGGTGTLGKLVARHLVRRHAVKHLLLVSRQGVTAPGADALRRELEEAGAVVTIAACDVADRSALQELLAAIPAKHPLTAVLHTAGILDDGVLDTLTRSRLDHVLAPKADAAWNLHELTKDRGLAAFVLFSSISGVLGTPGQANYAAANTFLDALAHYRKMQGLAAISLAWGYWADASGMTAHLSPADLTRIQRQGILPLTSDEALALLDSALKRPEPTLVAARFDLAAAAAAAPNWFSGLVRRRRPVASTVNEQSFAQQILSLSDDQREDVLLDLVRHQAAGVLGLASPDQLEIDQPLKDAGLDSLMAVEIRNKLAAVTKLKLPATLAFNHPTPRALSQHLATLLTGRSTNLQLKMPFAAAPDDEPIAIVAMSCRFPGDVRTPEELWELLRDGRDVTSKFPNNRGWDLAALYDSDPDATGKSYSREGGFLLDADRFDPEFFGISRRVAPTIDPQQRLLLELSWEALERAGLDPTTLRGSSSGVFVGIMYGDYANRISKFAPEHEGHMGIGSAASVASGRLAYYLDLHGPAISLDTACSSSLVAVHMAAQALRRGECSLALAGGVTVMTTPTTFIEFSRRRGMAPDGRCKSFAAEADGAGWSEGAGMLVLERLSEARRHGHPVLALLRGSAINQDGRSQGLGAPNGPAQESVIRQALASARLQPADVAAVEAQGTGTPLGDPIEAQALFATYGAAHTPERPLWLGSLKSNLGHAQAAAGVGGVIKMVLALQNGMLPRTLHVENPSAHIDWSPGTVRLLADAVPWPAGDDGPRRAAVSAFGISGTNAHVILEEAPTAEPATADVPTTAMASSAAWPILLSAKSPAALKGQAEQLRGHLSVRPDRALGDLAYSLATTRTRFEHRAAIVASDHAGLLDALEAIGQDHAAAGTILGRARSNPGKLAFVFPGQGSQWQGMARSLLETSPVFRSRIEACETALSAHVDWSLSAMLHDVDDTLLDRVDIVQPALFAVMVSLAAVWRDMGIVPDAVIGHSQGEVAAAVVAGAISLADGARIVTHRSLALSRLAGKGGMASVELGVEALGKHLARWAGQIEIAAVNSSCSTLVSGNADALDALVADLTAAEIFARRIRVDYASHGTQVEAVRDDLLAGLEGLSPVAAELPLYSTVTAQIVNGCELDAGYWYRNLREPVRFGEATERLVADGFRFFVEISPHPVLTPALQESVAQAGGVVTGSLRRGEGSLCRLLLALAELHVNGLACNWQAFFEPYKPSHVPLPTYAFQRERFWIDGPHSEPSLPPSPG